MGATGAAFAVGIGYMDPGNWATDLDATRFDDALLWAVLASGIAGAILQLVVIRFAAAGGEDLATAIARRWPQAARWLWPLYALAIVATEIAEFVGLVIGLQLLLNLDRPPAIALATAIFAALLMTGATVGRRLERLAVATTAFLALAYAVDLALLRPAAGPVVAGALLPSVPTGAALAVVGIVGATIMPHNLFLHGGLVLDRLRAAAPSARPSIERSASRETIVALTISTIVNASILVVGVAVHARTVEGAFATLSPIAGPAAATLFGLALVAVSLAATASGACAADIVCHQAAPLRLTPLSRRACAVGPAAALLACGVAPTALLVGSQVALGLILPAVVVPLLALVLGGTLTQSSGGRLLLACSSIVVVAALSCDGVLLATFLSHVMTG
jgi:manganese transport protein